MSNAAHGLKIKYGLAGNPTESKVQEWARLVRQYVNQGRSSEEAGNLAARYLFPDYRTRVYASEADTIEALLREAEGR